MKFTWSSSSLADSENRCLSLISLTTGGRFILLLLKRRPRDDMNFAESSALSWFLEGPSAAFVSQSHHKHCHGHEHFCPREPHYNSGQNRYFPEGSSKKNILLKASLGCLLHGSVWMSPLNSNLSLSFCFQRLCCLLLFVKKRAHP